MELLKPINDIFETTTLWSFKERGSWATHKGSYRGNWSPYIPRNIIRRYSQYKDTVLDVFVGGGTTLVETKLLGRNGIGIDINPIAVQVTNKNLEFECDNAGETNVVLGDARNLEFLISNSIDLICTHPPYANIVKYSENIDGDISHCEVEQFLDEMGRVAEELYRVLREGKYCAILIGDIRKNKNIIPLGFMTMQEFTKRSFKLKEIVVKEQHNCRMTKDWEQKSIKYNFLLLAHEYLFIMEK